VRVKNADLRHSSFAVVMEKCKKCKFASPVLNVLIWECTLLGKQRHTLKNNIIKAGGRWSISNNKLANKYMNLFLKFVNTVDFETL
jgi:hypothetical protein